MSNIRMHFPLLYRGWEAEHVSEYIPYILQKLFKICSFQHVQYSTRIQGRIIIRKPFETFISTTSSPVFFFSGCIGMGRFVLIRVYLRHFLTGKMFKCLLYGAV